MPNDIAVFTGKDADGESTRIQFNIAEVTAAGIDAQVTALGTLRVATEALMELGFRTAYLTDYLYSANPVAANSLAQTRE